MIDNQNDKNTIDETASVHSVESIIEFEILNNNEKSFVHSPSDSLNDLNEIYDDDLSQVDFYY